MARSFNGSSDKINGGDVTAFNSATALTLAAWAQRSDFGADFFLGKGANSNDVCIIRAFSDGNIYVGAIVATANGYATVANNSTAMQHLAMVYDGSATGNSNRLKFYINGSLQTLSYVGTVPAALSGFSGVNFYVGWAEYANVFSFGTAAEVGLWSIALAANDVTELSLGYSPRLVRPDKLANYWPLLGGQSPEPDHIGGKSGTLSGTSKADHPRVLGY